MYHVHTEISTRVMAAMLAAFLTACLTLKPCEYKQILSCHCKRTLLTRRTPLPQTPLAARPPSRNGADVRPSTPRRGRLSAGVSKSADSRARPDIHNNPHLFYFYVCGCEARDSRDSRRSRERLRLSGDCQRCCVYRLLADSVQGQRFLAPDS